MPDGLGYGKNLMAREVDFHTQMGNRPYSKFINVAKYAKKRNLLSEVSGPGNANFCECFTAFMIGGDGFNNGQDMGTMKVTYYVSFIRPAYAL